MRKFRNAIVYHYYFYFLEQEVTKLSPETQPHFRGVTKSKKRLVNANVSPYKAAIDKLNIKPRDK